MFKSGVVLFLIAYLSVCSGQGGFGPGEQDSGYVEVRPGAHMFYWLFHTTANVTAPQDRPLVIWLQGGPGVSSSFGLFVEFGPLLVNLTAREVNWVDHVNILLIDNPVGTGYSYVDNSSLINKDLVDIGKDLVTFIQVFYNRFPQFLNSPLHIFSESYGGKYALEFGRQLYPIAPEIGVTNFVGVEVGDAWISPADCVLSYAPYLFNLGFLDQNGYNQVHATAQSVVSAMNNQDFALAHLLWSMTLGVIQEYSISIDNYNVLYEMPVTGVKDQGAHLERNIDVNDPALRDLMNGPVKQALAIPDHVTWVGTSNLVYSALQDEMMVSVTDIVETILNTTNLQVNVVIAHLDLIVNTPGTVLWVDKLQWSNSSDWLHAKRKALTVDNILQGYVKELNRLHLYEINRAGHMIPTDNPYTGLEMLRRITGL